MSGINATLFTAKEGLLSSLTAINVTGSNIANVNTPGYTRLRPIFETTGTTNVAASQAQTGVRIADVEQVYNQYLNYQIVQQQSAVADYTAQQDLLQRVESILNENMGGGINDALGEFLNAWGNLSLDPSSKSRRDMVISTGENLAYVFNQRAGELINIQNTANNSMADAVDTLNGYLEQMAKFNETIVSAEMSGSSATSVRDERGKLINEISKLIDINYIEKSDGSLYIYLPANGSALVEGFNYSKLAYERDPANNNLYKVFFADDTAKQSILDDIKGGKLAGLLEVRDVAVPSYLDQLNKTAETIMVRVNNLHTAGFDQYGVAGGSFFDFDVSTNAAKTMQVLITDPRQIAASTTGNADGNNATAITAIRNETSFPLLGNNVTIDGFYNTFIANMGQDVAKASQAVDRETTILNQRTDQREQLSGVSIDEEMMNLIKFQMAYGAAGKVTQTVKELMDTLMNLVQ